ncbi:MAG: GTP-binding protein, partial [bacterium]|nr:GTP-binding protein [bacterium]
MQINNKIPVILVTGFLGSGKTTFINTVLGAYPNLKISIILNEFGDTKLESQFIKTRKGDVVELSNGCMCCVAQQDFERIITWILNEKPETQCILIEASGLSDPLPIATTLQDGKLSEKIKLETIVCIVDCLNFFSSKEKHPTVMVQLANSDIVLLSKHHEVTVDIIDNIHKFLQTFLPRISCHNIDNETPLELILNTDFEHETLKTSNIHTHEEINTLFWKSEKPLEF